MYAYGGENALFQEVQNLWAWISHPETKPYEDIQTMLSNGTRCIMRFKQRTSLTCMTLLNNSCPLNIAVKIIKECMANIYFGKYNSTELKFNVYTTSHSNQTRFSKKDTDSLDCFEGHFKCYCPHASAFPILVLQNVSPHYHACHTEYLFQLLPAHLVVKL